MPDTISPFTLNIPDSQLSDLRERLDHTRWPAAETVADTSQGPRLASIRALVDHWRQGYDWRQTEGRLNALGQFRTTIDDLNIHFLHVRSAHPDALPLILTHGWPSSVLDFEPMIGPLTDPVSYGGDPADAFHLVIPSLPGFGFSQKPAGTGWNVERTATAWITLMNRLGYERWGAHGGDIGAAVTDAIGRAHPGALVGLHYPFSAFPVTADEITQATPAERAMLDDADYYMSTLSGYFKVQMTRPQTIGYSLDDSPVGLAAWIYAMFQDVSGTPGNAEASFTLDQMIDTIMMYWLPGTGASSARMYWETGRGMMTASSGPPAAIAPPAGFTMFPYDHVRKSRRWIERRYSNVVRYTQAEHGGHFAALEQPRVLVDELRATFADLR